MSNAQAAQTFVEKWDKVTVNEKASAQEHFVDLCRLLGQPTPIEADPGGTWYRFEKSLTKAGGGAGFADVWKRNFFAWEYKTKGKYPNLSAAYQQLLLYRDDLDNPPVLAACDIANYELYISFTGHKTRIERFTNADLATAATRELLRLVFTDPQQLRPAEKITTVTERIAADFAQVAQWVERRGHHPQTVAHFFMKLLFAMFAEDIGLLPNQLLSNSIKAAIYNPAEFNDRIRGLFRAMRDGGFWGMDRIPHFNGGLFDDDVAVPLTVDDLMFLSRAAAQDWRDVEPAIFGTLFERSLDPSKRAQLGAHYTSKQDILLLVEPVLMRPLRHVWAVVKAEIEGLRPQWEAASGGPKQRLRNQIERLIFDFMDRLRQTTVLDAACGSGNFLYVALNELKNLEKEVITYATGLGLTEPEQGVGPHQLFGIERNPFAAELAQVVVWIGNLQWNRNNGFWRVADPVLQKLDTIRCEDAILSFNLDGSPSEPDWPTADVILGNPPFLGDKKMRSELGDIYVDYLRQLYTGRIAGGADLVTYWFERARAQIEHGKTQRAGLLATNSIRNGANRRVLERIKGSGDIFYAQADRPWVLDGAAVRVSMVGFDDGSEQVRERDGQQVSHINPDLSAATDVTQAVPLKENAGICFLGMMKGGPFDIDNTTAQTMLNAPANANGRPNSDVVKRRLGGQDVTGRLRNGWIIDFGAGTSEEEAAAYEQPFAYVREHVKPIRDQTRRSSTRTRWWIHGEARPALRQAIRNLQRCIVTPEVAKHRLFVWMSTDIIPDHKLHVFARDDDYFFGVLHSRLHELWSLRLGSTLEDRPSYASATTFETVPLPWSPSAEPQDDPKVKAIAEAARELVQFRDEWLNPPGLLEGAALRERTLTNLYNQRPDWLDTAHKQLDEAVFGAYGWPKDLDDDPLLERLLRLNTERA